VLPCKVALSAAARLTLLTCVSVPAASSRAAHAQTLAHVFRGIENCSALRKTHVLHLARSWGYKSDVWCARARHLRHRLASRPAA
jgi:hypothetical protein